MRTQILRTRQKLTSISEVSQSSGFVLFSPIYLFFSRGSRDRRGIRETFLPQTHIITNVTNVALLLLRQLFFPKNVKFSFQVRRNCVIWLVFLKFYSYFRVYAQEIMNPLCLLSRFFFILTFFSYLHLRGQ